MRNIVKIWPLYGIFGEPKVQNLALNVDLQMALFFSFPIQKW